MIRSLIYIGLIVTPFLSLKGYDTRWPKEFFALMVALCVALWGIHSGVLKKFENKSLLFFVGWCLLAMWFVPKFKGLYLSAGGNVDGLWNYKPLFHSMVYLVALVTLSSMNMSRRFIENCVKIMAFAGFLMACYCFLQHFGIDQFFTSKPIPRESLPESSTMGGTLGNPTLVAPFILACIPMAAYLKKYWMAVFMAVVVVMTRSDVALVAMILTLAFCLAHGSVKKTALVFLVLAINALIFWNIHPLNDNGRFGLWSMVWFDMTHPVENVAKICYFLTGWGMGSFNYLFSVLHDQQYTWTNPHNEYLAVFYGVGFVGLILFLKSIWFVFKKSWNMDGIVKPFIISFFALCLCAGGTFVWHLGAYCIYSVVILGIIHNFIQRGINEAV